MRYQLKQIISFSRGPAAWDELLRTEGQIRKKRQEAIYAQQERRQKFIEWTAIVFAIGTIGSFLIWLVWMGLKAKGYVY